jgi:hypothetical protein
MHCTCDAIENVKMLFKGRNYIGEKMLKDQQNNTSPRIVSAKTSMPCFTKGYNYQKNITGDQNITSN